MSQKELAGKLGVDPAIVSKLEHGWFTRAPGNLGTMLTEVFGREWTFARLMEPVPDLTTGRRAKQGEP